MRKLPLLTATLAACGRLAHVPPAPRSSVARRVTVVRVSTSCAEPDYTSPEWNSDVPGQSDMAPWIEWEPPGFGTGVVISENAVLTAAHVVRCPIIPDVVVTMPDRKRWIMQVDRDDAMFGDGTDLAHLEAIGAYDRFGLNIPPPTIAVPGYSDYVCVQPYGRDEECGSIVGRDTVNVATRPGDSGSPVYEAGGQSAGALVGLVVAGGGGLTQFVPLNVSWLEGT